MLNSIGLQNPGLDVFLEQNLLRLAALGVPIWVSVGGFSAADFAHMCERLDEHDDVVTIELNLSCPNVEEAPETAAQLVPAARLRPASRCTRSSRPRRGTSQSPPRRRGRGCGRLSLINTIRGLAVDRTSRRPKLGRGAGGYSGPALGPIALACVYACAEAVDVPIVGMGGVASGEDVSTSCGRCKRHRARNRPLLGPLGARSHPGGSRDGGGRAETGVHGHRARIGAHREAVSVLDNTKRPANRLKQVRLDREATLVDSSGSWSRPSLHAEEPARSLDQRMEALQRANDVRVRRAQLKRDLKAGQASIETILLDPPEWVETAKVFDMLMAVPKFRPLALLLLCPCNTSRGGSLPTRQHRLAACAMQHPVQDCKVVEPLLLEMPPRSNST